MKTLTRACLLSFALVAAAPVSAGSLLPVGEPVEVPFLPHDGTIDSLAAVRGTIVQFAGYHGWTVADDKPGRLRLSLHVRRHSVLVDVAYDLKHATITYVSSENLEYTVKDGVPMIHPGYLRWATLLGEDIQTASRGL